MNTIEGVLDPDRFLRIHRSHIVNVRRIAQLWSVAHGQYVDRAQVWAAPAVRAHLRRADPPRAVEPVLIDAGAEAPAYCELRSRPALQGRHHQARLYFDAITSRPLSGWTGRASCG